MSGTAELEDLYSAIEESARLLDVACSRETVWPVLAAYGDAVPEAVICFRVATDARHSGELNCHLMMLPPDVDPYAHAVSEGLVAGTGHPVGALLSDIRDRCPVAGYGIDFGVVGGFQKAWSIFPADAMQDLPTLAGLPSMPRSLAGNLGFFTDRRVQDRVSLVGIDYARRTANVYFGELPAGCLEPEAVVSMHREIGLPDPSDRMLEFGRQAFGFYVTLSWDSPRIERISFSVMTPDPLALPVQLDPTIEHFLKSVPYGTDGPKIVYAAMTSAGEEYYKLQSYYQWRSQILHFMQLAKAGEGR
ncbi:MAG TPA: aromatic prenyltransferase [Pseudonocardiaceae bacterium]